MQYIENDSIYYMEYLLKVSKNHGLYQKLLLIYNGMHKEKVWNNTMYYMEYSQRKLEEY